MGEQENCGPATRSSKKRATSVAQPQQLPNLKRRVVLGELTNSPNIALSQCFDQPLKKRDDNSKKEADQEALDKTEILNVSSVDPQRCAYSSSIYQHLHSLEVLIFTQNGFNSLYCFFFFCLYAEGFFICIEFVSCFPL